MTSDPRTPAPDGDKFLARLGASLADDSFVKLVLSKYRGPEPDLQRVTVRRLALRGVDSLSFVYTHRTRDITKNMSLDDGLQSLRERMTELFGDAHLLTRSEDLHLMVSKKGQQTLRVKAAERAEADAAEHDREKHRFVDVRKDFLVDLGVTNAQHQLVPAMARKWKQINKFVEVLDGALRASSLATARDVRVVDFGAGKGYLTFAMHDYLRETRGLAAQVTGVELREDLVRLCNDAARRRDMTGLEFRHGDVRHYAREPIDIMVALHACDVATDYAIDMGIRSGASIILCSPCCHKQIRPQLLSPHPLRPILQHGVHLGQEAEMLTDGLRALLLDASGYDTQVFEFISLEHTNKNKMILAVKRSALKSNDEVKAQIAEIKAFYGIREHALEALLVADGRL